MGMLEIAKRVHEGALVINMLGPAKGTIVSVEKGWVHVAWEDGDEDYFSLARAVKNIHYGDWILTDSWCQDLVIPGKG